MNNKEQFATVREFMRYNYRHFNAGVVIRAADAYIKHLDEGGKMLISLAGAMSTAEIGLTLADMIRQDKVHIISCTGANLEEDIFNLVAHDHYVSIPDYRSLSAQQEEDLFNNMLNRVTDVCIPEEEAMIRTERHMINLLQNAEKDGKRYFPHEMFYELIRSGVLEQYYQIDPKHSWMVAAAEKNLPIVVPGWEDSTMGNVYVAKNYQGILKSLTTIKSGLEYMDFLITWYKEQTKNHALGFYQIGGGIAGDFPICVVPIVTQDLKEKCRVWSYFCQISDSTTSYGSYSGAVPNEKITWGKLKQDTPSFIIESDASIVAPLMFAYIMAE